MIILVVSNTLFSSASQLSNQQLREKQAALARLIKEIEAQIGDTGDQGQSESYSDEENNMTVDGYEKGVDMHTWQCKNGQRGK